MISGSLLPKLIRLLPRLFLSCAALLTYSTAAAQTQDADDSAHTLRGTVINSVTHEPIPRALVFSFDDRFAMFADDQGHFEFKISSTENPNPGGAPVFFGPGQLNARKPGFLEKNDLNASISPEASDITIPLTPESLIIGRVNVPASNQFDRISVELYKRQVMEGRARWVNAGTTRTRSNGEFRIANLTAGTYKIFTGEMLDRDPLTFNPQGPLVGYPPIFYPSAVDFVAAAPIILEAGKTVQVELSPVLQPYYPVKIAINNAEPGSPITVSVAAQGHKGPGFSLGYSGEAIEGSLPNGTYTVEATRYGTPSATGITTITVHGAPLITAAMTLLPSGSIPVNIRTDLSASVRGASNRAFRRGFSPQQMVNVSLQSADEFDQNSGGALQPRRQPDDTPLAIEGTHPGRYWVNVNSFQEEVYVAAITSNGRDLLRNPLVVGPGGSSAPIEITLRDDAATLDGTVDRVSSGTPLRPLVHRFEIGNGFSESSSGSFAAFVCAVPLPDSPGRFTQFGVQPDGTFHGTGLAPGTYRILAFDQQPPDLEYLNPDAMRAYDDKGPVVRLAPNGHDSVHLSLIRTTE